MKLHKQYSNAGDTHTQTYTHIHKSEDLTKNLEENIAGYLLP